MLLAEFALLSLGLLFLYFGAEGLVAGASSLALRLGITPLVVGLTVVAFGTSAPELLVSLLGSDDVSAGNIIGSNIANLALILGASAIVRPLKVQASALRRDYPAMIVATLLFIGLAYDGVLSRLDGAILLAGMALYLGYTFFEARRDKQRLEELLGDDLAEVVPEEGSTLINVVKLVLGLAGLVVGAQLMVDSAIVIAQSFGVSELVIGISIVAIGTSLPELATSTVASYRDESDISVGNVVGSNLFNILLVLGVVALARTLTLSADALNIDLWVMLGITLIVWPLLRNGYRLNRWEGALLLVGYAAYMALLFQR